MTTTMDKFAVATEAAKAYMAGPGIHLVQCSKGPNGWTALVEGPDPVGVGRIARTGSSQTKGGAERIAYVELYGVAYRHAIDTYQPVAQPERGIDPAKLAHTKHPLLPSVPVDQALGQGEGFPERVAREQRERGRALDEQLRLG